MSLFSARSTCFLLLTGLLLLPACERHSVSRTKSSLTAGGRQFNIVMDGTISSKSTERGKEATVEISFAGGKLVIEKDRVMLNAPRLPS